MNRFAAFSLAAALTAVPLAAQEAEEDAGGLLVDFLEDTLSGESRHIRVTGLEGALSSRATIEKLTVADEEGVWLTIEGAELDWNRLALLRGRFSVNTLKADSITVARAPGALPQDPDLPAPEAEPFRLPELPVAIEVDELSAGRIELGEDLLGTPASLTLSGALKLADGALETTLNAARLDQPGDRLELAAGFSNETRVISLDLTLNESAGGIVASALDLPGRPTVRFTAQGEGPVTAFKANIALDTNSARRLDGKVSLSALGGPVADDENAERAIAFAAELKGDIDPLLQPPYRPFFGPGLQASLEGRTGLDGGAVLDNLVLRTRALQLTGALRLKAGGIVEDANLKAAITPPNGQAAVVIPFAGPNTAVGGAEILASKTARNSWEISAALDDLSHPSARVGRAAIDARGTIDQSSGFALEGKVTARLNGLEPRDPALAKATGSALAFSGTVTTAGAGAVKIADMELSGTGYGAAGELAFDGLESGLRISGALTAQAEDLSRFSDLAGQPLGGAAEAEAEGFFTPLSGAFGGTLALTGEDLSAGIAKLDELIAGRTTLDVTAERGENGIRIDNFSLQGQELEASAKGRLSSTDGRLDLSARLQHLEMLLPQAPGPFSLTARVVRREDTFRGSAEAAGPHSSRAKLSGAVTLDGDAELSFDAAVDQLQRFVPGLAGRFAARGSARRSAGNWQAEGTAEGPAGLTADVSGSFDETEGNVDVAFDAVMSELQQFIPEIAGRLTAKGTASRRGQVWQVQSTAAGPAGIDADVAGTWNEASGTADATAQGTLRLEGLNPFIAPNLVRGPASFDLRLQGQPGLDALSGTVSTAGASLAIPAAAQQIEDIAGAIRFARSRATVEMSARPRGGGQIRLSGPVDLRPPYNGTVSIGLSNVVLTDNLSYETTLNGELAYSGALSSNSRLSGRIDVGETNINLAAAGGSVTSAPIPPIRHVNEPAAVRATRARAGLLEQGGGAAPVIALDVLVNAPNRIFARGRGLRAELGGAILVRGTAANPAPSGQIGLIRGSFDIFGRRLNLDEGRITLVGDLKPYLLFRSSASTAEGTASLELSGRIDSPEIKVTSEPPRPSEEALALLLFGDSIENLSPLALARVAASVAELSGRGGRTERALREGTGADNVELGFDNLGAGLLGLGGYVADNVYTDFNVNTEGESELTINLDVTNSVTVKGTVESTGETGLGVFFQRDY
ncbi:translocation/assembly module TamB domain-containing protein [Roseobacteraceae bacterium NS-SX3]